ncbi:uncharacterized protein F5147DRAFT_703889 [Suillus discolor]|uniref:Uncharacterized protein n=1 Tax=Suillus discolor TaxID=1912936 RepID=A0A9P7F3M8_9AGAM|nr:uncharacterized protein F5147DRAFT_703889 [Suillus discolor]KAG2104331.1 hypothetical protein F5147DRAFT_703889 [Suillus discolor]
MIRPWLLGALALRPICFILDWYWQFTSLSHSISQTGSHAHMRYRLVWAIYISLCVAIFSLQ